MMAKWFGRRGRWVLWIALAVVGLIGVADVTVRALAHLAVKSTSARELLVTTVGTITLDEVAVQVGMAIDALKLLEKIYAMFFCGSPDETMEKKLREASGFVSEQARQLSVHVLRSPPFGLGWRVDGYRFEVKWSGTPLAIFSVNWALEPVNIRVVEDSAYRKALEQRLERKRC